MHQRVMIIAHIYIAACGTYLHAPAFTAVYHSRCLNNRLNTPQTQGERKMVVTSHFVPLGRLKKVSFLLQCLVHFITLNRLSCCFSFLASSFLCFHYSLNPFIHLPFILYIHSKRLSVNMLTCLFIFFTFFCIITPTLLPSLLPQHSLHSLPPCSIKSSLSPSLLITVLLPSSLPPYPDLSSLA